MSVPRALAALCLLLLLAFVVALPARADDREERADDLEDRIEILIDEMRILHRAGHKDAAELLEKRVHVLRRELAEMHATDEAEASESAEEVLEFIFETLNGLVEAEDDKDAVNVLMRALQEVAGEMEEHEARERRAQHPEIVKAKKRLATMRVAFKAFLEAEKHDAAHLMEYAIHALELGIEGRRDEEAQRLRKNAPDRAQQIELLRRAAALWASWGHEAKAAQVGALARELAESVERKQPRRLRIKLEADEAADLLAAMKLALPALREAEKPELAKTMHKALRALEIQLEGRTDDEARQLVAHAPNRENVIELLFYAADLYQKWGKADPAEACRLAGKTLLLRHREAARAGRTAIHPAEQARHAEAIERFENLQRQTAELLEMAQRMRRELERLKQEMQQER